MVVVVMAVVHDAMVRSRDGSGKKRVRTACISCRRRKIRCDGGFPCEQCSKACYSCEYNTQKVKRSATDSSPMSSQSAVVAYGRILPAEPVQLVSMPRELTFNGVSFGSREMRYIHMYLEHMDASFPAMPHSMLRDGVNPVEWDAFGMPGLNDGAKIHASKASSWAAAALGASFSDVSLAQDYMAAAIRSMRHCFEVPTEESITAYIMVGTACYQLGKPDQYYRYVEFADAMEESMPPMSPYGRNVLALTRCRACFGSNRTRLYPKATILPPLEEIQGMDIRFQVMFIDQICTQKVEEVFNAEMTKEEKVRVCREVIETITPILEQLETEPQYKNYKFTRLMLYAPLTYFWAVCGDRGKAVRYFEQCLDMLEQNLFYMAIPSLIHIGVISSLLGKLGAFDLQRRVERYCRAGTKYLIWTPAQTTDMELKKKLEALVEELQPAHNPEDLDTLPITTATDHHQTQDLILQPSDLEFSFDELDEEHGELWDVLDAFSDCNYFLSAPSPHGALI